MAWLGVVGCGGARHGRHGKGGKTMSAYKWKTASYIKADAEEAGKMCEELSQTIGLTPESLLEANKAEEAPLHNEFEWDDTEAAHKYRLGQARHIIQCLITIPEGAAEETAPVRAFFVTEKTSKYEHIDVILHNEDKRAIMLRQAIAELNAFKKKYAELAELTALFEQIALISA